MKIAAFALLFFALSCARPFHRGYIGSSEFWVKKDRVPSSEQHTVVIGIKLKEGTTSKHKQ